jgi:hypothetical protein
VSGGEAISFVRVLPAALPFILSQLVPVLPSNFRYGRTGGGVGEHQMQTAPPPLCRAAGMKMMIPPVLEKSPRRARDYSTALNNIY